MKISLTYYPNPLKKNVKTGKIPIYMRVCFNRQKSESRLNAEIHEDELLKWDPINMRILDRNSPINQQLNRLETKFNEFLILNCSSLSDFNAVLVRDFILGNGKPNQQTIQKFVDEYFQKAVVYNVDRAPGTIKNYRRAINHLNGYLRTQGKPSMLLTELNYDFAFGFKNYLVSSDTKIGRIGMTEVSAAGIIKKFRTIFTDAVSKELIKKNPFKLIKIKTKSPRRERLTIEQVKKIIALDLNLYPYQELYRDIFLFSVYTGLAYQDAMNLKWLSLEKRKNGGLKLSLGRQKSEELTECFLPNHAIEIIQKYESNNSIEASALPYRSNKEINSQLKFIATLAGIPIRLTHHIARHTYRQLLAESGITDYGVIKRMMGHNRKGDVDEVYYSVTENRLLEAKEKFDQLLQIQ